MPLIKTVSGTVFVILLVVVTLLIHCKSNQSAATLPILGKVPDFTFTEMTGQPFGKDNLKDQINIVDFIFTKCQGACPIMSSKMAHLYKLFKASEHVHFISITVDPQRDTFEVLKEYAKAQGVNDNRWHFLRAPIEQVIGLSEQGFKLAAENLPMGHSTRFVLVDDAGFIRGYYDGLDEESINILEKHIRGLLEKRAI